MRGLLLTVAAVSALGLATPVFAADAAHPYSNIDRRVDAGNGTGDARTAALNQAELGHLNNPNAPGVSAVPTNPPRR